MKQIQSIEEIRKIQLDILEFIDNICKENNIPYFLSGGTLLGAIRHKGYIPWDDDIDIMLLRKDYDKLVMILKNFKNSNYKLLDGEIFGYYFYFSKLVDSRTKLKELNAFNIEEMGVYIDIFPLDSIPDNIKCFNGYFKKICYYNKSVFRTIEFKKGSFYRYKEEKLSKELAFIKSILRIPLVLYSKIIGLERWKEKREKYLRLYDGLSTKYIGIPLSAYDKKDIHNSDLFNSTIQVLFEGKQYPAPCGYDIYLKNIYGNYMELPPKDKRFSHHIFYAYWRE